MSEDTTGITFKAPADTGEAAGAAPQTLNKLDGKLEQWAQEADSFLAITFRAPKKPDRKHLTKIRNKARALFEEAVIDASKSYWRDGVATVAYRGYIYPDLVPAMVRERYLVDDLFAILETMGAQKAHLRLGHKELPAECHAFVDNGKLLCRLLHQGRYIKGFVSPGVEGATRGGEEAQDPDIRKFNRLFDDLGRHLNLSYGTAERTVEECTDALVALGERKSFAVLPRLKRIGVEHAFVIVDFDQGKAISRTFPEKLMAIEWLATRIHDQRDGIFSSDDYGLFDAVATRFFLLKEDFTWVEDPWRDEV